MTTTPKTNDINPRIANLYVGTQDGFVGLLSKQSQHVFTYGAQAVAQLDQRMGISLTMPVQASSYQSTPMLPVFQTSLPEGFLKEHIVEKFSKTMRMDDMALLAFSGANRVGRLRVSRSEDMPADDVGAESLKEIMQSEGSRNLFQDLCDKYLIASGISGVQPKVVLNAIDDVSETASGIGNTSTTTDKKSIGEKSTLRGKNLIIKIAGDDYLALSENEFHCLSIASAAGISVPDFWISDDRKRLAIQRFDIDHISGRFLGFEDMVSLQGKVNDRKYEGSYENIAAAIKHNASPQLIQSSLDEFFASVVLSVALRNGDAHLKNFGLIYTDATTDDCKMSPVYDVVCTTVYLQNDLLALSLGKSKSWPNRAQLIAFGKTHCGIDQPAHMIDRIIDTAAHYQPNDDDSGIWRKIRDQIEPALFMLAGSPVVTSRSVPNAL
jgi:serine/threonine-protein kinase HipA